MIHNKNCVKNRYRDNKITLGLVAARKGSVSIKGKNLIKIRNQEITKIAINMALK